MKKLIRIIIAVTLLSFHTGCTDNTTAFIQQMETTQAELKKQDSMLIVYRTEVAAMVYTPPVNDGPIKYSILNTLNSFSGKISPLITRLELMIEKNKTLVEQVKTNSGNPKQIEKEYQTQIDELELIKPEIATIKTYYEKIVADAAFFKGIVDTTQVK